MAFASPDSGRLDSLGPPILDLVRYSLGSPHAGRLDYGRLDSGRLDSGRLDSLGPPILDLVGFSPGSLYAGSLHSGRLQSETIDFGSGDARAGLLALDTLGGYKLGPRILDLETHALDCWQSTLWEATVSGHRFWIWRLTCFQRTLQCKRCLGNS